MNKAIELFLDGSKQKQELVPLGKQMQLENIKNTTRRYKKMKSKQFTFFVNLKRFDCVLSAFKLLMRRSTLSRPLKILYMRYGNKCKHIIQYGTSIMAINTPATSYGKLYVYYG